MPKLKNFVSAPALYALSATALLILFFELWRVILLIYTRDLGPHVPTSTLIESFLIGARFDLRVASVIVLPLFLLATIPWLDITRYSLVRKLNLAVLSVVAAFVFFIHVADLEYFDYFNTRINGSALLWSDRPGDVAAMIWQTYPVISFLILWAIILGIFLFILFRLARLYIRKFGRVHVLTNLVWAAVTICALALGLLGRIYQVAPMRWGLAYFSQYDYANQLAINPTENVMRDIGYDAGHRAQIQHLVDSMHVPAHYADTVRALLAGEPNPPGWRMHRHISYDSTRPDTPNVILVINESFAASKIGALGALYPEELTPRFDSLANHSILFTNFYSAGTHTYSGLFTSLYGTSHLFGKVVMKQVRGHYHYYGLPSILRDHGFYTVFFTTQDPHFDNMQGFLMAHGVEKVFGIFDYDQSQYLSWLGVPDHTMFDTAITELRQLAQGPGPFFATLLTGSNHGPWRVPDVPFARVPDTIKNAPELNAIRYADWALVRFVDMLFHDPAFKNTIIILTADNGYKWDLATDLDLSILHIPLLICNTSRPDAPPVRVPRLGDQTDILSTVMGMLRLDYDNYSFGNDLFDTTTAVTDFALCTRWYEMGYMEGDYYFIRRLYTGRETLVRRQDKHTDILAANPEIADRLRRHAMSIYRTTFEEIQKPIGPPEKDHPHILVRDP